MERNNWRFWDCSETHELPRTAGLSAPGTQNTQAAVMSPPTEAVDEGLATKKSCVTDMKWPACRHRKNTDTRDRPSLPHGRSYPASNSLGTVKQPTEQNTSCRIHFINTCKEKRVLQKRSILLVVQKRAAIVQKMWPPVLEREDSDSGEQSTCFPGSSLALRTGIHGLDELPLGPPSLCFLWLLAYRSACSSSV